MEKYLKPSHYIDSDNSEIIALANSLAANLSSDENIAKKCFEWVRDNLILTEKPIFLKFGPSLYRQLYRY